MSGSHFLCLWKGKPYSVCFFFILVENCLFGYHLLLDLLFVLFVDKWTWVLRNNESPLWTFNNIKRFDCCMYVEITVNMINCRKVFVGWRTVDWFDSIDYFILICLYYFIKENTHTHTNQQIIISANGKMKQSMKIGQKKKTKKISFIILWYRKKNECKCNESCPIAKTKFKENFRRITMQWIWWTLQVEFHLSSIQMETIRHNLVWNQCRNHNRLQKHWIKMKKNGETFRSFFSYR